MTFQEQANELRRVKIDGHQTNWDGRFHTFATVKGVLYAVVEDDSGRIHRLNTEMFILTFLDRDPVIHGSE